MADPGVGDRSGEGGAPKEHGELRTFLIADIRGYTLFTQRRGDAAAAALAMRFADLTREIVQAHDGSVVEFRGDEALCAFTSTRQAIVAALALQERFVDETAADHENPLPVGIGLDAGEAVPVENGYRGAALNLAARLCGRAGPGEILATTGVVHLAGKVDGVRYVDRGTVRLKNVPEPVGLIKILPEGRDPAERLRVHWQPPPQPPRRGSRARLGLVAVALTIGLVAALLPSLLRDEALGGSVAAGSIGVLDGSGHLTGQVRVGDAPGAVVSGAGAVWVSDAIGGTLARLDPVSGAVLQRIPLAGGLGGVAVSEGDVWVANTDARTVSRIDPGSGPGEERVVATIPVGNGPDGIAAGDGRLWVANSIDATVTEIDAKSGAVLGTHPIGALPTGVAIGGGRVWISERGADAVAELDPGTGEVIREIAVGRSPEGIAWGSNAVWVANSDDGTVSRIDPASASVTSTVEVGADPVSIAAGGEAIWVAQAGDGMITQLDASGSVVRSVPLTNAPEAVAIVDGSVWVAVQASLSSHRGGTLNVGANIGLGSLDPGSIFDTFALNQLGPILAITNDGLVALRRVGGIGGSTVVPDLAATLPVPSNEGTTYTFVLRDDVRFSNGEEITPVDVRSTFERLLSQSGASDNPFLRHASVIQGAAACGPGVCDLSRGIEDDDDARTVTFHLTRSDPDFLRHLALPSFVILPEGTPVDLGTAAPAATGPYVATSFIPEASVVLERNGFFREWSSDAQPDGYPDRIVVNFGMTADEQVDAVVGGDLDVMYFDHPTPERLAELETQHPQQVHPAVFATTTLGLFMNVRVPPFDDVRAREAVSFALDREELARLFAARQPGATPIVTCTIIGPGLPGYVPYCPYTSDPDDLGTWSGPDLSEAKRLVRASGTRGTAVTIWGLSDTEGPGSGTESFSREVARVLDRLGYRTSVKLLPPSRYLLQVSDQSTKAQIGIAGLDASSGSPSEFIVDPFSCPGPGVDSMLNFSRFCDRSIDDAIDRALSLQETDQYAANRAWEALDHRLVDLAPIIPFATPGAPIVVSERVGNYQQNPLLGVLLDQLWVR